MPRFLKCLLPLLIVAPVAPAHAQIASFDCHRAQFDMEWAICNTPELGKLDIEMGTLYRLLLQLAPAPGGLNGEIRQMQSTWTREKRDPCGGNVDCLNKAYQGQISSLQDLARKSFTHR